MTRSCRPSAAKLAAIVLFTCAFVLFVAAFAAERQSFDPWSPDRKFCGRLAIHIVGAGNVYDEPDKQDASQDIFRKYTLANLENFGAFGQKGLPTATILITSDADLKKDALALAQRRNKTSQFVVVPASADAFEEFLSKDVKNRRSRAQ